MMTVRNLIWNHKADENQSDMMTANHRRKSLGTRHKDVW